MTIQNTSQNYTLPTANYTLKSLLDTFKESTSVEINCHHIGTIQTFDPTTQTATATVNYTRTYFEYDPKTNSNQPVQINYPQLMMCPVICLGGGSASLTFPIQAGDECLILFNDRSIDNWLQSGNVGPLNSPRLHSISDGIILVGLRNSQKVIQNYDTTHAVLQNGSTQVALSSSQVKIANASKDLGTILQNLLTAIEALTVTCPSGGGPSSTPINAASFVSVASDLAGLLE